MPAVVWINMRNFMQGFLLIMGLVLMMGVQGGIDTAVDLIDWFWIVTVFVGAACVLLVAIRIDAFTE